MSETATRNRKRVVQERPYLLIMIVLAVVTAIEVLLLTPIEGLPDIVTQIQRGAASSLGRGGVFLALMGFAAAKATAVALYYMHLKYETWWIRYIPLLPLIGVAAIFATFAVL